MSNPAPTITPQEVDLAPIIQALCERMQTDPDDFDVTRDSKFGWLIAQLFDMPWEPRNKVSPMSELKHILSKDEMIALRTAYRNLHRTRFNAATMALLICPRRTFTDARKDPGVASVLRGLNLWETMRETAVGMDYSLEMDRLRQMRGVMEEEHRMRMQNSLRAFGTYISDKP